MSCWKKKSMTCGQKELDDWTASLVITDQPALPTETVKIRERDEYDYKSVFVNFILEFLFLHFVFIR